MPHRGEQVSWAAWAKPSCKLIQCCISWLWPQELGWRLFMYLLHKRRHIHQKQVQARLRRQCGELDVSLAPNIAFPSRQAEHWKTGQQLAQAPVLLPCFYLEKPRQQLNSAHSLAASCLSSDSHARPHKPCKRQPRASITPAASVGNGTSNSALTVASESTIMTWARFQAGCQYHLKRAGPTSN